MIIEDIQFNAAIQLFGLLVLTFLGIIAPFIIFILSFSREGRKILITKYAEKSKNYENEIREIEDKKPKEIGEIENKIKEIDLRLRELKKHKKASENKIKSLDVRSQALYLFIPLIISFILIILSLLFLNNLLCLKILIFLSVILFFFSIYKLWKLFRISIEVRDLIEDMSANYRSKTLDIFKKLKEFELLSAVYGTEQKFIDVTEKLKQKIKNNRLTIKADNNIDGDPHVGKKKKLTIDFISFGQTYRIEIPENETRTLPDDFIKD